MPTSNIDDFLMGGKTNVHPATPEDQQQVTEVEESQAAEDSPDYEEDAPEQQDFDDNGDAHELEEPEAPSNEVDDYGNEKESMPKGLKDRLDRKEKQHQREIEQREREIDDLRAQLSNSGASREVQQAARDFEYDPQESGDWQQQLASFVKQTINSMSKEESESKQRHQEQQLQREFETKFKAGIGKFSDFVEVMSSLPFEISNPMTLATRAMNDPAAFLYAAAKRQPQELERISRIRDPYAQMTEIGKLEERMRKNKPTTQAPRPLGRTAEDSTAKEPAKKKADPSIEEQIRASDARRLAKRKAHVLPRGR